MKPINHRDLTLYRGKGIAVKTPRGFVQGILEYGSWSGDPLIRTNTGHQFYIEPHHKLFEEA